MSFVRVNVRQIRGSSGQIKKQRNTLKALGLGRIGKVACHVLSPAVEGMLRSVSHLVVVGRS